MPDDIDGSSVRGFAHIDNSDLLLLPDRATARTVSVAKQRMIGMVIADVYKGFHSGGYRPSIRKSKDAKAS